jgi:hypothetical protein
MNLPEELRRFSIVGGPNKSYKDPKELQFMSVISTYSGPYCVSQMKINVARKGLLMMRRP